MGVSVCGVLCSLCLVRRGLLCSAPALLCSAPLSPLLTPCPRTALANPYPKSKLELFWNGKPATLARDPNIANNGTWLWAGYEAMKVQSNTSFTLEDARGALWKKAVESEVKSAEGLWLHGFWKFDW